jgi:hypothetical protein
MKVQVSLDMSHIMLIKSVSSLIVFALLQTTLCNGGLMAHTITRVILCNSMCMHVL